MSAPQGILATDIPSATAEITYSVIADKGIYIYTLNVKNTSTGTFDIYSFIFGWHYNVPITSPLPFKNVVLISAHSGWYGYLSGGEYYGGYFINYGTNWQGSSIASGYIMPGQTAQFVFTSTTPPLPSLPFGAGFYDNAGVWEYAYNSTAFLAKKVVDIDIKPDSFPNSINLKSKGNVPVAILSSPTFDATTVDWITIVFAGAGPFLIGQTPEDVNGDGLLDVVLHFSTQDLNLRPGDNKACLSGETLNGQEFKGCDSVRIVK